ncbi:MAG: hypothetical protein QM710_11205 [Flavobacterium sp.]
MKNQYPIAFGISAYIIASLIIMHWVFICSPDEFFHLYKKGFALRTISSLPLFLKPLYTGLPNLITLISFMLFTFSAFLLINQKRKAYYYMSMSSFVMIAYLFLFLIKT